MGGEIRAEGTCKPTLWWALPGPAALHALTPWLIKVLKLIHEQHDTDLSLTTLCNMSRCEKCPTMEAQFWSFPDIFATLH